MNCRRIVKRFTRIASFVCANLVVAAAASDDVLDNVSGGLSRLLSTVSTDTTEDVAHWRLARDSAVALLNSNHPGPKQFEVQQISSDQTSYSRVIVDIAGSQEAFLCVDSRNLPMLFSVGRNALLHTSRNGWGDDQRGSHLVLTANGTQCTLEILRSPDSADAKVKVDLQTILDTWYENASAEINWIASTHTLRLTNDDGFAAAFRFRTPDDQLRFGTPLGELALTSADMQTRLTSFVLSEKSHLFLNTEGFENIAERMEAKSADGNVFSGGPTPPRTGAEIRASLLLWNGVTTIPQLLDTRPPRDLQNPLGGYGFRERLLDLVRIWQDSVLTPLRAGEEPSSQKTLRTALTQELDVVHYNAMLTFGDGTRVQVVDDPALLWRGFELAMGPVLARQLIDKVLLPTVTAAEIPLHVRTDIARNIGRLGRPPWYIESSRPAGGNAFCTAILKSCWQLKLTSEEVKACRHQLQNNDVGIRNAAVETLALSNHVKQIPREHLDAWFDVYVRTADKNELSKWARHCKINMLSLNPEGRAYLLGQLTSDQNTSSLKQEIVAVLTTRVRAARQLKRYDFMTLAESNQLVEVMNETMKALGEPTTD